MTTPEKFPRTLRLDTSDLHVFPHAAEPGEWAVPGGFAFEGLDPGGLDGKTRQALAQGWLGTLSWGFSTLVEVAAIDAADYRQVVDRLAHHFVARFGAPDHTAALPAAEAEARAAAELCEHPVHTLLALERAPCPEGLIERYRVIRPERAPDHARIWTIEPE